MSVSNKTINDLPIYDDERLACLRLQASEVTIFYLMIIFDSNESE